MSIYITTTNQTGPAIAKLIKAELNLAAKEINETIAENVINADVTILIVKGTSNNVVINGKNVNSGKNVDEVIANLKQLLKDAAKKTKP